MTTAAAADTEKAKKKLGHIRLLQHVANGLLATRKVREALPIFTSIVGLLQTDVDFGPKHRETGAALVHKAACLNLLGRRVESVRCLTEACDSADMWQSATAHYAMGAMCFIGGAIQVARTAFQHAADGAAVIVNDPKRLMQTAKEHGLTTNGVRAGYVDMLWKLADTLERGCNQRREAVKIYIHCITEICRFPKEMVVEAGVMSVLQNATFGAAAVWRSEGFDDRAAHLVKEHLKTIQYVLGETHPITLQVSMRTVAFLFREMDYFPAYFEENGEQKEKQKTLAGDSLSEVEEMVKFGLRHSKEGSAMARGFSIFAGRLATEKKLEQVAIHWFTEATKDLRLDGKDKEHGKEKDKEHGKEKDKEKENAKGKEKETEGDKRKEVRGQHDAKGVGHGHLGLVYARMVPPQYEVALEQLQLAVHMSVYNEKHLSEKDDTSSGAIVLDRILMFCSVALRAKMCLPEAWLFLQEATRRTKLRAAFGLQDWSFVMPLIKQMKSHARRLMLTMGVEKPLHRACDSCAARHRQPTEKKEEKKSLFVCRCCRLCFYCSKQCQRKAWPNHRDLCRPYVKTTTSSNVKK